MGTARKWTEEETKTLEDGWGTTSIPTIAKNLNRSINAIRVRAQRLGLGSHLHQGEYVTFNELCIALGKQNAYSTTKETFTHNNFPFRKKKVLNKSYLVVCIDEFWKWAEQHKELINFVKFEENILGAEPQWVKEKRRIDTQDRIKKTRWTSLEDERLITMLKKYRYTYTDISKALNRGEAAIKRRINILGLPHWPIKAIAKDWAKIVFIS